MKGGQASEWTGEKERRFVSPPVHYLEKQIRSSGWGNSFCLNQMGVSPLFRSYTRESYAHLVLRALIFLFEEISTWERARSKMTLD